MNQYKGEIKRQRFIRARMKRCLFVRFDIREPTLLGYSRHIRNLFSVYAKKRVRTEILIRFFNLRHSFKASLLNLRELQMMVGSNECCRS